jgi:hypothetical protein
MAIRTELTLRLPNSPGALAGVCLTLSDARINILAMALDASGQLRLVVDNSVHAAGILRERHHQVAERSVLLVDVENTPGALAPALASIADAGVNVEYAYGAGRESTSAASVVVGVSDAMRAAAAAGV